MSSNHPSLKEKNVKLLKEVDEVSGVCGLLKPAAQVGPEPDKNMSGLQSVYWLLCKACSRKVHNRKVGEDHLIG
jgi:hypothetical protein